MYAIAPHVEKGREPTLDKVKIKYDQLDEDEDERYGEIGAPEVSTFDQSWFQQQAGA